MKLKVSDQGSFHFLSSEINFFVCVYLISQFILFYFTQKIVYPTVLGLNIQFAREGLDASLSVGSH